MRSQTDWDVIGFDYKLVDHDGLPLSKRYGGDIAEVSLWESGIDYMGDSPFGAMWFRLDQLQERVRREATVENGQFVAYAVPDFNKFWKQVWLDRSDDENAFEPSIRWPSEPMHDWEYRGIEIVNSYCNWVPYSVQKMTLDDPRLNHPLIIDAEVAEMIRANLSETEYDLGGGDFHLVAVYFLP